MKDQEVTESKAKAGNSLIKDQRVARQLVRERA